MTPEFGSANGALITGAAKRIGAAMARGLAEDGWHIYLHYHRSVDAAEALAADIRARGGGVTLLGADLSSVLQTQTMIRSALEQKPLISLLINNASLFSYDDQAGFDPATWEAHAAVNLRAPALLTQAFANQLGTARNGLVVNMLDAKLFALNPDYYSYTVSKYGLLGLTELQARALAPNIRVNGIAPAVTLVSGPQSRENFASAHVHNPLGRGVTAEQIVTTLKYLINVPALTGQVIGLDAGQRLMGLPRDVAFMVGEGA